MFMLLCSYAILVPRTTVKDYSINSILINVEKFHLRKIFQIFMIIYFHFHSVYIWKTGRSFHNCLLMPFHQFHGLLVRAPD